MKSSKWAVCALLLLFLAPTNSSARFDGVPFTSWWEVTAVVAVLLLFANREGWRDALLKWEKVGVGLRRTVVGGALFVVAVKCVVYLLAPTAGQFEVCYRGFSGRSGVPCLETFEPVPSLGAVSQHFPQRSTETAVIDFGPRSADSEGISDSTWRLPFINSLDFDRGYWPWEPANKSIETFPFWAEYRGSIDLEPGDQLRVSYLGQGRANIGGNMVDLPPSYERTTSIMVADAELNNLLIDFAYLQSSLNSDEEPPPYALLRIERIRNGMSSLMTAEISIWTRLLNLITDSASVIFLLGLLWLARVAMRRVLIALFLGGLCWLTHLSGVQIGVAGLRIEAVVIFLMLAFVALRRSGRRLGILVPAALVSAYSLTFRELELTRGIAPRFEDILVMLRGNDHLVYQGLTREMLNSGFLRGAEDVYYFQPGIRYVFYFLRLVFGESGFLTGVVCMSLLVMGIFFCFDGLPKLTSKLAMLTCDVAGVSLLVWWSSSHTIQSTIAGLSEFATWILLLGIFGLILRIKTRPALPVVSAAAAAVVWIRPNQGFGMIALLMLAAVLRRRSDVSVRHVLRAALIPFGIVLSLIPLHNLVFGNTFALLPTGHQNALQTSWLTITNVFSDVSAREFMLGQLRGLLYLPSVLSDIYSARLALAVLGFAVVMLLSTLLAIRNEGRPKLPLVLLLGSVVGQLVPFLRFSLYRYYPIHNVAIYLTLVLCCVTYVALVGQLRQEVSAKRGASQLVNNDE